MRPAQLEDGVPRGNLRVLEPEEDANATRVRSPGHDLRTCAACGARTVFTLDPAGTWFRCSRCGEYA
jgi:hypothetical protein